MSETSSKPVEIGVVLQGGGALGAYECGALNALLELMDEFAAEGREIVLKVVTGVSIGSINAACVVGAKNGADARARLDALWDDLTLQAPPFWMAAAQRDLAYFGLPGFYTPRPDFWTAPTWTYVYDTRPLLATGRCRRQKSSLATCWRAVACRRHFPGPKSTVCRIGMAASSTTRRSAWPSTRSAPILVSSACWWS
jgi:Patatin-like phospholipase